MHALGFQWKARAGEVDTAVVRGGRLPALAANAKLSPGVVVGMEEGLQLSSATHPRQGTPGRRHAYAFDHLEQVVKSKAFHIGQLRAP